MRSYCFYIVNILLSIGLQAQNSKEIIFHETALQNLRKGNLLVRLESKENKIQHLKKELENKDCTAKCSLRIEKQIEDIIQDRNAFNSQFINSFQTFFTFCPVYFYYDKDHQKLENDQFKGNYYLDEKLNIISVSSINEDSILILKKDNTTNSENEGWLFQTAKGMTLKNGFPYIDENNITTLFNRLSSSDHLRQNCNYRVKKLNSSLYFF